jgi:uncharacterized protein YndB with AHSA1/START domain
MDLMTTQQHVTVRETRRYTTSPERVFDAWLDSAMIGRWMFGPNVRDEEIVHLSLDPRVGGRFSFVVRRQGQEIDHVGEYLEIDRPRRLAFTWGVRGDSTDFSKVIIDIAGGDQGADLTLTHELHPDWADYASRTEAGWTRMLDTLAKVVDVNSK